jgi:vesicle coat complex subunit
MQCDVISCCCLSFCCAGEIFELKAELNSDKKDRKKEAVKKVIASMTVGKDVR